MADTKISALTAATAALGADELAINEAGTSKKLTVAQIKKLIVPFDITDPVYGAVGDNSHDDTTAIQAAFTAAIAAGGRVVVPGTLAGYKITSTINIVPAGAGTQVWLDIDGDGLTSKFIWAGSANTPMFLSKGWKASDINGIYLDTANVAGVVGWDIDVNATQVSAGFLTFKNCLVETGTGGTCVGWRGGISTTGPGDISFVNFDNCRVTGQGYAHGDIGWQNLRQNGLNWNWYGGAAYGIASAFSNTRPGGGESGGGSMAFYGFGTSGLSVDFDFRGWGKYAINGGRFEVGKRFVECGSAGSTSEQSVSITDVQISSYSPSDHIVFHLNCSTQFTLERSVVENNTGDADFTAAMITVANGDPRIGKVGIRNCVVQAAEPFYTISGATGTWTVLITDCLRRNVSDATIAGSYANLPALGATPGLTLGTANAAGSAATFVKTDATIAIFDATVPSTQAFGDAALHGAGGFAADVLHKHAMPALPAFGFDYWRRGESIP